jgi:hypothetical protein
MVAGPRHVMWPADVCPISVLSTVASLQALPTHNYSNATSATKSALLCQRRNGGFQMADLFKPIRSSFGYGTDAEGCSVCASTVMICAE